MDATADKHFLAAGLQELGRIKQGEIHYAGATCRLGWMLAAVSWNGVCFLAFADELGMVSNELHRRFPKERVLAGGDGVHRLAGQLADGLATPLRPEIPFEVLDLRGTAFQLRVWHALRDISAGKVASYGEIARRIGRPKAVRAVASACAANPVAVLVPCHRIVRSDGGLSGYHWGVWRKRALLAWEQEGVA